MSAWPPKDPDAVLDYIIDWNDADDPTLAAGETITTSTWTIVGTVVKQSDTHDTTTTTIWLTGGTDGEVCRLTNHILTSAARQYDKTVTLRIREQ